MGKTKEVTPQKKRLVSTLFILVFNSFIITAIAIANSGVGYAAISIALFLFQAILTKNFVESQYFVE